MRCLINLQEKSIDITGQPDGPGLQIDFCFFMYDEYVDLTGISFGYELKKDSSVVSANRYPPDGLAYIRTNVELVTSETLALIPGQTYSLSVWCQSEELIESSKHTFTLPIPDSPFASWVWDDMHHVWEAPVPYPTEGGPYVWDEEAGEWVVPSE